MRRSPRASLLAGLFVLPACGGPAPAAPADAPALTDVPAPAPGPGLGAPCGPEAACAAGLQCVGLDIVPHTGKALPTCEQPCAADADCDALVPEAERACVAAARAATVECQCTPGTTLVRCVPAADAPQVRVCDRRATFQDYGRPRCQ